MAGKGPRAEAAQRGFRQLCEQRLPAGEYEITVVDVLETIKQAYAAGILVTPTIVRTHPLPAVRVMGDVSASTKLGDALGLPAAPERGGQ